MKHVLIVDDSQTIRREVSDALSQAGFAVVEAEDGVAGLECARLQEFSMILVDVNMPRMGGLDMLDHLKRDPKTASIPVLLITTEADAELVQRARDAGAKGWLVKPIKLKQVVSTVSALAV